MDGHVRRDAWRTVCVLVNFIFLTGYLFALGLPNQVDAAMYRTTGRS